VAAEGPVHRLGQPNGEALEPAGERAAVLGLDDEVKMIALGRELQDSERAT